MDIALNLKRTTTESSMPTTSTIQDSAEYKLISACLNEERWAQKKMYEMYYPQMMGVCMRYAANREEARDILNEGYIKVFRNLHKYQVGTSLESWMKRIMVTTSIDYFRKNARHRNDDLEDARYQEAETEDGLSKCTVEEIMKAVQSLPASYRAVFNLYAIEGYSHKEVAELLGITESTSRSNLVKARSKLQEILAFMRQ